MIILSICIHNSDLCSLESTNVGSLRTWWCVLCNTLSVVFLRWYICHTYVRISPCSSLSTPQLDLSSWGCPQWQYHTYVAFPSTPQWCYSVLSAAVGKLCWWCQCEHNRQHHHDSTVCPSPWYPVQFFSESLHCGFWTVQCSTQCTHCWWWGYSICNFAALFVMAYK